MHGLTLTFVLSRQAQILSERIVNPIFRVAWLGDNLLEF